MSISLATKGVLGIGKIIIMNKMAFPIPIDVSSKKPSLILATKKRVNISKIRYSIIPIDISRKKLSLTLIPKKKIAIVTKKS